MSLPAYTYDYSATDFYVEDFGSLEQLFKFWAWHGEYDPVILTLVLLKNNWGLDGDLTANQLTFTTGWYDSKVSFPQICIRPVGGSYSALTTGGTPRYQYGDALRVSIFVRPKQDSNTSIGWAKSAMWRIRREVERILKSGSRLGTGPHEQFVILRGWRERDNLTVRPVLFSVEMDLIDNFFRKSVVVKGEGN